MTRRIPAHPVGMWLVLVGGLAPWVIGAAWALAVLVRGCAEVVR